MQSVLTLPQISESAGFSGSPTEYISAVLPAFAFVAQSQGVILFTLNSVNHWEKHVTTLQPAFPASTSSFSDSLRQLSSLALWAACPSHLWGLLQKIMS